MHLHVYRSIRVSYDPVTFVSIFENKYCRNFPTTPRGCTNAVFLCFLEFNSSVTFNEYYGMSGRRHREARSRVAQQPPCAAAGARSVSSGQVLAGAEALHTVGEATYRGLPLRVCCFKYAGGRAGCSRQGLRSAFTGAQGRPIRHEIHKEKLLHSGARSVCEWPFERIRTSSRA